MVVSEVDSAKSTDIGIICFTAVYPWWINLMWARRSNVYRISPKWLSDKYLIVTDVIWLNAAVYEWPGCSLHSGSDCCPAEGIHGSTDFLCPYHLQNASFLVPPPNWKHICLPPATGLFPLIPFFVYSSSINTIPFLLKWMSALQFYRAEKKDKVSLETVINIHLKWILIQHTGTSVRLNPIKNSCGLKVEDIFNLCISSSIPLPAFAHTTRYSSSNVSNL